MRLRRGTAILHVLIEFSRENEMADMRYAWRLPDKAYCTYLFQSLTIHVTQLRRNIALIYIPVRREGGG